MIRYNEPLATDISIASKYFALPTISFPFFFQYSAEFELLALGTLHFVGTLESSSGS
jgi:hypothetical protein